MSLYSIIDISSTSISMIIAQETGGDPVVCERDRQYISMLSYLEGTHLTPRGIEKAVGTIRSLQDKAIREGVSSCHIIGTASLRHIDNLEEIQTQIASQTGLGLIILDGTMEAYCDAIANSQYRNCDRPVLIDIGGASVEICDLSKQRRDEMNFLDFGAITLNQRFVSGMQPDKDEAKRIKKYLRKQLESLPFPSSFSFKTAILVGATNKALYEFHQDLFCSTEVGNAIQRFSTKELKHLATYLVEAPDRSYQILKHAPERIHILAVSAIILKEALRRLDVEDIIVSDAGVKEGYLKLLLSMTQQTGTSISQPKGA